MTVEHMEAYVRAAWGMVGYADCGETVPRPHGVFVGMLPDGMFHRKTVEEAWKAAYDFTKQHEREIAELEEEILIQSEIIASEKEGHAEELLPALPPLTRTLQRLERELADKKRGMRGEGM